MLVNFTLDAKYIGQRAKKHYIHSCHFGVLPCVGINITLIFIIFYIWSITSDYLFLIFMWEQITHNVFIQIFITFKSMFRFFIINSQKWFKILSLSVSLSLMINSIESRLIIESGSMLYLSIRLIIAFTEFDLFLSVNCYV